MPTLLNPRHERFAIAIFEQMARGKGEYSQGKAYQAAGYKCSNGNSARACASRLLTFANGVAQRIQELQAQQAKQAKVTVQSITEELEEARALARVNNHTSTMVQASGVKAKIHGIAVDRIEQGKPGDFTTSDNQSAVVDLLLRNAGVGENEISEGMRAEAHDALAHFNGRLRAIIAGELGTDQPAN